MPYFNLKVEIFKGLQRADSVLAVAEVNRSRWFSGQAPAARHE